MKALLLARKYVRELLRERMTLALLLLFPAAIIVFYYIAFGETEEGLAKFLSEMVLDQDQGYTDPQGERFRASESLIALMGEAELEGEPLFKLRLIQNQEAGAIALQEHRVALMVVIPPNFSQAISQLARDPTAATPIQITLHGDPHSDTFVFARSLLGGLIRQYALGLTGWEESVDLRYSFIPGTGTLSDFDFGVSGVLVFGITFVILASSEILVHERVQGTLRRLRLAQVRTSDLLIGLTLAMTFFALVQLPITLGSAILLGFQNNGSLFLVLLIGFLMNLTSIGIGLIIASYSRNPGEATTLASVALVPLIFLSDAMYPMPKIPLIGLFGRELQIYDLLPTSHAAHALRRITFYGEGFSDLKFEIGALVLLSLLLLGLGIRIYRHQQMRLGYRPRASEEAIAEIQ